MPVLALGAGFGMQLQGLQYSARSRLRVLGCLMVEHGLAGCLASMPVLGRAWEVASLLNYLAFLARGRYPSLAHRLLGVRLVPGDPDSLVRGQVDLEYMSRQLLWQALTEAALTVSPAWIGAAWGRLRASAQRVRARAGQGAPRNACVGCSRPDPAMKRAFSGCGHTGCYYCFAQRAGACPVCVE
jgi:peroxin-2